MRQGRTLGPRGVRALLVPTVSVGAVDGETPSGLKISSEEILGIGRKRPITLRGVPVRDAGPVVTGQSLSGSFGTGPLPPVSILFFVPQILPSRHVSLLILPLS